MVLFYLGLQDTPVIPTWVCRMLFLSFFVSYADCSGLSPNRCMILQRTLDYISIPIWRYPLYALRLLWIAGKQPGIHKPTDIHHFQTGPNLSFDYTPRRTKYPKIPLSPRKWLKMACVAQISLRLVYYHIIPTKLHYNTHTRAHKTNTHTAIDENSWPSMLLISTYTRNTYVASGTNPYLHFPLEIEVLRVPKPIGLHTI